MSVMLPQIRRKNVLSLCAVAALSLAQSGCQVGHSWFQMDSNSSMPFFGVDLLPRRTSQLTHPTDVNVQLTSHARDEQHIRSAAYKADAAPGWKRLQVPTLSKLRQDDGETSVSLNGPSTPFVN